MAEFEVKFAADQSEIEQAQRLRFEVFNLELNKGPNHLTTAVWTRMNSIRTAII
jgi:hypothetical protein